MINGSLLLLFRGSAPAGRSLFKRVSTPERGEQNKSPAGSQKYFTDFNFVQAFGPSLRSIFAGRPVFLRLVSFLFFLSFFL